MFFIAKLIFAAISFYELLIFIRCLTSWFHISRERNVFFEFIYTVTEPVMKPFRLLIPPLGGMDFSPLLVFMALEVLRRIVVRLLVA